MTALAGVAGRRAGLAPIGPPAVRRPTVSQCVCGGDVVLARTVSGEDVFLDADRKGAPKVFAAGGAFVEVASEHDVLGRRPLVVQAVGTGGQYRLHGIRCSGPAKRDEA